MEEEPREGGKAEHLLKNISNNVKQERREGIALAEATPALDPASRDAI
jgi:hypothetical protein